MEINSVAKGQESTAKSSENELFFKKSQRAYNIFRENAYKPLISPTDTH